jgi:hypothetical protein
MACALPAPAQLPGGQLKLIPANAPLGANAPPSEGTKSVALNFRMHNRNERGPVRSFRHGAA